MTGTQKENYYEARGFSVYYLANAVFNIVLHSGDYLRGIEEILGDARAAHLMRGFHRYTNLHEFIREIATDILTEEVEQEDGHCRYLREFLNTFNVPFPADAFESEDSFWRFASESSRYHNALDELTEEVFHVLFNDVGFLQAFNQICATYIESASGFGDELKTQTGCLKRVRIPKWARRAIFHRDKGECRSCKRSLAAVINRLETERYDHIVPLACFGANDVTNLQLLCEPCNLAKSAEEEPVSRLYQRAFR
ncbi:HNH endonuclease [Xanthobacter sp. V4C-4]|uniref:HNH endonuclease n=1 Tax=Xanthobacter cornucopiae TaxID=3119924 RepID=UPI00372822B0